MRKSANPRSFAIVYQQEDPDTQYDLIHRTWVYGGLGDDGILYPGCLDKDRKMGTIPHGLHGDIISIATVDPSPSQYWAVEWWLYQPATELRYLIDVTTKRMSAEELLGYDLTEREHRGLMVDWQERSVELGRPITHWVVEVNAAQRFLLAHDFVRKWIAKTGVAIVPHTTGMNKLNEELGVEALLKPLFKSGRVRLPFASSGGSQELVYLCGHSLGAQPTRAADCVEEVMRDWRSLGVDGHFAARHPWMTYHERAAATLADLVGAAPNEVVAMNTLTANLHLLLVSFYRPHGDRTALLVERHAFPSDRYGAESQVRFHGLDPARDLIELEPRPGEACLRTEDVIACIERAGPRIATILLPGVQYLTGQRLDIRAITAAGRRAGCTVGWDLARAIGNVPLALHDADADFAVWCSYKYLNGGPGAPGGAFVHARHARGGALPRFAGWWGNRAATRFHMRPEFEPLPGADGWQVSTPSILAMAPVLAALDHFTAVGLPTLRAKSVALTGYLESLIAVRLGNRVTRGRP